MNLTDIILSMVPKAQYKSIVQIGAHDDSRTLELAEHFKHVYAFYEFSKIPERAEANYEIRRLPYIEVLNQLERFDVILLENEFHHFPDILQMWTYARLGRFQEMLLVEWDFTGSNNFFYSAFQNCTPLCTLTREILSRFISDGVVEIEATAKGRYEYRFNSRHDLIEHYRFILPDHFPFGEKDFLRRIAGVQYPHTVWEGFDVFKLRRAMRTG